MRDDDAVDQSLGPALRYGRALLLALVALVFGIVAHVTAGGLMPAVASVVVLVVPLLAVNAWLLGRQATALRLCVLLVLEQTVVHGGLTALAGHASTGPGGAAHAESAPTGLGQAAALPGGGSRSGSYQDLVHAVHGSEVATLTLPTPVQHVLADLSGPNALMAVGHLVAAVGVALWLAWGERALWTVIGLTVRGVRETVLARLPGHRLAVLARTAAANATTPRCPAKPEHDLPPRLVLVHRVVRHRGPPALLPV